MKLYDLYPDMDKDSLCLIKCKDDIVIATKLYTLVYITFTMMNNKSDGRSLYFIHPRHLTDKDDIINNLIYADKDLLDEPVMWTYETDIFRYVTKHRDTERVMTFKRYYIFRNGEIFYTENLDPLDFSPQQMIEIIKQNPFNFDTIDWKERLIDTEVKYLGYIGKIIKFNDKTHEIYVEFDKSCADDIYDKISLIPHIFNHLEVFPLRREIDVSYLCSKGIIRMNIMNPYLDWKTPMNVFGEDKRCDSNE